MKLFSWVLDEKKFLNPYELQRLLALLDKRKKEAMRKHRKTPVRDWFVISLGLHTGLRVREMVELEFRDLNIVSGNSSLIVRNGKCGRKRLVRFSKQFWKILWEFIEWKRKVKEPLETDSPVIFSARGKGKATTRSLQLAFKRNTFKAGIKGHSIHHLRHTYASHLYKASNYNLRLVQKQLGHSSIKTTEVYADVFQPDLDRALEKLYSNITTE